MKTPQTTHSAATFVDHRSGFTLVELLIAVSILLVLAGITVTTLNYSAEQEKISNGTRDMQTYLKGARDRAIFRRAETGVRLILDQNGPVNGAGNPRCAASMVYIGVPEPLGGRISIEFDTDNPANHLRRLRFWSPGPDMLPGTAMADDNTDTLVDNTSEFGLYSAPDTATDDIENTALRDEFTRLNNLGLLGPGSEIILLPGGSTELTYTLVGGPGNWRLSSNYVAGNVSACMDIAFRVKLLPSVLPNQQPRELPRGVVMDLEACRRAGTIPTNWYDSTNNRYSSYMDILFSPRGVGAGTWSAEGQIQLLFADAADVEKTTYNAAMYDYTTRDEVGRERVISINAQSGNISMTSLNLTDSDSNGILDDPFLYAETGVRAP